MSPSEAPATVNQAALSGVRFLVSRRIEELETAAADLEQDSANISATLESAATRVGDLEQRWHSLLQKLPDVEPKSIDSMFRHLANARADLATAEERHADLDGRVRTLRAEQEMLRAVYRSLDDLAAAGAGRDEGTVKLRSASRQVFQIIEEERMRIARDMHDGPAQSMSNLVLQAEILERLITRDPSLVIRELRDFKDGVRGVLDDTRRLIFDLRPMTLDDLGLVPTLRKFVKEFAERTGVTASLRIVGEEERLPGTLEPTLFRIVQEALNNVRKHAQAETVEVIITFQPTFVSAVVRDDGVGMDLPSIEAHLDGARNLGFISMRERAELEKGRLEIRSEPGRGAEVRISVDR